MPRKKAPPTSRHPLTHSEWPQRECGWCGDLMEVPPQGRDKKFGDQACAQKWRRANRAATLGELVERLGPFVCDDGLEVYRELVGHLAGRVNESA